MDPNDLRLRGGRGRPLFSVDCARSIPRKLASGLLYSALHYYTGLQGEITAEYPRYGGLAPLWASPRGFVGTLIKEKNLFLHRPVKRGRQALQAETRDNFRLLPPALTMTENEEVRSSCSAARPWTGRANEAEKARLNAARDLGTSRSRSRRDSTERKVVAQTGSAAAPHSSRADTGEDEPVARRRRRAFQLRWRTGQGCCESVYPFSRACGLGRAGGRGGCRAGGCSGARSEWRLTCYKKAKNHARGAVDRRHGRDAKGGYLGAGFFPTAGIGRRAACAPAVGARLFEGPLGDTGRGRPWSRASGRALRERQRAARLVYRRQEFRPARRARAGRSILGATRGSANMQKLLNLKGSRTRESFRPFAPSVCSRTEQGIFAIDVESP